LDLDEYVMNDDNSFFYVNNSRDENGKIMTKNYVNSHKNFLGFVQLFISVVEEPDTFKDENDYQNFNKLTLYLKKKLPKERTERWISVVDIYDSIYNFLGNEMEALGIINFLKQYDFYYVESYFFYIIEKWLNDDCFEMPPPAIVINLIHNVLDYGELSSTGTGLNHLALTEGVLDNRHFTSNKPWFHIRGGMDQLPKKLSEKLINIEYNSTVFKIEVINSKVKVWYYRDNKPRSDTFDRIIITVPFSSVRRWKFDPLLSYSKTQAIRSFNYDHATKIGIKTIKRFWEEDNIHGGYSKTDLPLRTVVYPSYGKGEKFGSIIVSYTWQNDAIFWANMNDIEQKKLVLQCLEELHITSKVENPNDVKIKPHVWLEAFAMFGPGQYTQMLKAMIPEHNIIHFAGEHLSYEHGWILGAMNSAIRVVREVMELEGIIKHNKSYKNLGDSDFSEKTWSRYMKLISKPKM